MRSKKLISVVTPCFNEEENIVSHFERVRRAIDPYEQKYDFEHIYCDNCSQDKTFSLLAALGARHKNLKAVRFSRNIGANRSIFLGLGLAEGEAAIVIQSDLQDPPELIGDFISWWEKGFDVVYGKIKRREESIIIRGARKLYYKIISILSDVDIPQNAGEFRLMSRRVLDAISQYSEDDVYLRGIIAHVGFAQKGINYVRKKRNKGRSSMNMFSMASYAINGLLSSTVVPIRLTFIIGALFSLVGFLLTIMLIILKLIFPEKAPHGFTTLGILITFFAGVQMLSVGVIGEYIRKIYQESLRRPKGFIQDKINLK